MVSSSEIYNKVKKYIYSYLDPVFVYYDYQQGFPRLLKEAVFANDTELVHQLLELGANPKDPELLLEAFKNENQNMIEDLEYSIEELDYQDIYNILKYNIQNGYTSTDLTEIVIENAILNNNSEIIQYLLDNNEDIFIDIDERFVDLIELKFPQFTVQLEKIEQERRQKQLWETKGINIRKRKKYADKHITEWQGYCEQISSDTNIQELRQISEAVALPIKNAEGKLLAKPALCAQLAIQMEKVLSMPVQTYDHSGYCNNLNFPISTDLEKIPRECLYKDENGNCFYINELINPNGKLKIEQNPYNRQPWNFDPSELQKKYSECLDPLLHETHEIKKISGEYLQKSIVRNILIDLDNITRTNNTEILLNANIDKIRNLVDYFNTDILNKNYPKYTASELENIKKESFAIDMLARFLSITRPKIDDDTIFNTIINQYLYQNNNFI